jgi:hypothetical protein
MLLVGGGVFHKFLNPSQLQWLGVICRGGGAVVSRGSVNVSSEIAGAPWVGAPKKALAWRAPAAVRPCRLVFSSWRLGDDNGGTDPPGAAARAIKRKIFPSFSNNFFKPGTYCRPAGVRVNACREPNSRLKGEALA